MRTLGDPRIVATPGTGGCYGPDPSEIVAPGAFSEVVHSNEQRPTVVQALNPQTDERRTRIRPTDSGMAEVHAKR